MTLSTLFHRLLSLWNQDPFDETVDILAADLAARVGAANHPVRVALVRTHKVSSLLGLTAFLTTFGITLLQESRKDGTTFVLADRSYQKPSGFEGAVVKEVAVRREAEVER